MKRQRLACETEIVTLAMWKSRVVILGLLEPYVHPSEKSLRNLWRAWCLDSDGWRASSPQSGIHLGLQLYEMFFTAAYKGCALHAAIVPQPPNQRIVHPACQCCTRPQAKPGASLLGRDGVALDDEGQRQITVANRFVRTPWWVARSVYTRVSLAESAVFQNPSTCLPRWQSFDPLQRGNAKRGCFIPCRAEVGMQRMDTALTQLQHFWIDYGKSYPKA